MSRQIYISGKFVPQEDAKISVFDHGLLVWRRRLRRPPRYRGKVFRLEKHVKRLYESAKAIWLEIPMSPEQMSERGERSRPRQQDRRRLHPPRRHARCRHARPRSQPVQQPASHHHRRCDFTLSAGALRERPGDRHGQRAAESPGRAQPADQVAQLPQQHPGQDRRPAGRLHRSLDAQSQGRSGRVHRRQHLYRAQRRAVDAAARSRNPGRHHARRRDRSRPRGRHSKCANGR